MLDATGRFCARFRWAVMAAWVVATVGLLALSGAIGGQATNSLTIPGASSQNALALVDEQFTVATDATATVLFHTSEGTKVTDADVASEITKATADLQKIDHVAAVVPMSTPSSTSADGRTEALTVLFDEKQADLPENGTGSVAYQDLQDAVAPYDSSSLRVELGGGIPDSQPVPSEDGFTLIGVLLALLVLLVVLGTWTSFAWPVVSAIAGVVLGFPLLAILQGQMSVPSIGAIAGVMVGLGVGIDYGLFMVGRYKDHVAEGVAPHEAIGRSMSTAGRAVLTAGATVIVALASLFVFDLDAVTAMAYAVVIFVVCVMLAATTLLPAVLAAVGPRITHARTPVALRAPEDETRRLGIRWSRFVTRHAGLSVVVGIVVLVAAALPVFMGDFRLGPLDTSLSPEDSAQYEAWELQSEAFGPGSPNPFLIVAQTPSPDRDVTSQLATLKEDLAATDGVSYVSDAQQNPDRTLAVMEVIPTTTAQSEETAELVKRLRDDTIPGATAGTDLTVDVSGVNAVFVDLDQRILDRLPIFIGLVVLIALLILGFVFTSVLVAVKAALLNLLVIGATYGLTVLVFTEGVGLSLLDVPAQVPILSLLAPVIFAVLFGLSNDYEVYLVTRTREELDDGASPREAVELGIGRGAHIVIAAALIMTFVFASYVLQPGTTTVQFGFAMSIAIVLDALVARMLLLPAILHLGGGRMWWPGRRRGSARGDGHGPDTPSSTPPGHEPAVGAAARRDDVVAAG